MDASEDEFFPGNASLLEVPVRMAPETEVPVLSPADMALRLLQQRLPTRQADGTYQISPDQYKACVLAIAPLQKLWVKAGEHDLQHCFGTHGRLRELLALVTPVLGQIIAVACFFLPLVGRAWLWDWSGWWVPRTVPGEILNGLKSVYFVRSSFNSGML